MTDQSNDGGAAFPNAWDDTNEYGVKFSFVERGMNLRDWFATHYPTTELSESWAAVVMGEAPPKWEPGNELNCIRWWIDADARVRFIHADAMLKARGERS
ncbi:hypothetical protein V5F38_05325 [Xanthobacter sp. V0B-10]|uniref:hypothetical protein n=1 Tax=Xanthobacter albus TaxID=3119929 RepID=UPI0037292116